MILKLLVRLLLLINITKLHLLLAYHLVSVRIIIELSTSSLRNWRYISWVSLLPILLVLELLISRILSLESVRHLLVLKSIQILILIYSLIIHLNVLLLTKLLVLLLWKLWSNLIQHVLVIKCWIGDIGLAWGINWVRKLLKILLLLLLRILRRLWGWLTLELLLL